MSLDLEERPPETVPPVLPDRYEVIDGEIQEKPPMSGYSGMVTNRVHRRLGEYGTRTGRGQALMDILYRVPTPEDPGRNRKPDAAFVSFDRLPENQPIPYRDNPLDVIPELVVEVVSPTDSADELDKKIGEYFRAGVQLVWVVYPNQSTPLDLSYNTFCYFLNH